LGRPRPHNEVIEVNKKEVSETGCKTDDAKRDITNSFVANPVNVATGNKYEEVLDLTVSTSGLPLEFRRSYNSQISSDGPLGHGWTHSYDLGLEIVETAPATRVRIWDADGRALYFIQITQTNTDEIPFSGESGVKDRLKRVISTGEYFLRRKEGNLTYKFGSDGKLLQISDPNGNMITLAYTGALLTQVSTPLVKASRSSTILTTASLQSQTPKVSQSSMHTAMET
jgi:hypothetical protein